MALQTFKNLKTERQEEILLIAYEEFALKGYQSASLSEIIKKIGIAKGSFYRYFASKKQLYSYLIEDAKQRRLSKLDNLIQDPDIDFFDLIKQNFMDKIKFDFENPVISGFLYQITHDKDNTEVSEIIQKMFSGVIEQTRQIIMIPKFKSQLADINTEMIAYQIFNMQLWLYDYISFKFGINYEKNIKERLPILNITEEDINETINTSIAMLRNGIQK